MRQRKSLVAGLICGAVCVVAVFMYAQEVNAAAEAERAEALSRFGGEQVEAYVATRDIAVGETLDAANCEKRLWIGELLPQDAVLDLAETEGKALSSAIYAGEVVSLRRFSQDAAPPLQVPEGLCAVSVPSKSVSTVGGSIEAGTSVDVYSTSGVATERIASSVLVLSTSATAEGGERSSPDISWVTLAVEPDLVKDLISAAQKADIYFAIPAESGIGFAAESDGSDTLEGGESGRMEVGGDEGGNESAALTWNSEDISAESSGLDEGFGSDNGLSGEILDEGRDLLSENAADNGAGELLSGQ